MNFLTLKNKDDEPFLIKKDKNIFKSYYYLHFIYIISLSLLGLICLSIIETAYI